MSNNNSFNLRRKINNRGCFKKKIISLSFIFVFLLSFIFINSTVHQDINSNLYNDSQDKDIYDKNSKIPTLATDPSIFQDPFTVNFSDMRDFFLNRYESPLDNDISIYYRYGDNLGNIMENTTFSEDNLLLYNSLLKLELTGSETDTIYNQLKLTPLWYEGNMTVFEYGFVNSINGTSGEIIDDDRYLISNLMPIFLLIENIDDLTINDYSPKESIEEIFDLINTTHQFWDNDNKSFHVSNSSDDIYTECNLYAILANLLINRTTQLAQNYRDRAFELANNTMSTLIEKYWDNNNKGFYFNATNTDKYLHVNALGIITLLDFWKENGSIDSPYYKNATALYDKLDDKFWDSVDKAYIYSGGAAWVQDDVKHDLEANSLMMQACLKLFDITGNITYYDRAIELYNTFEENFYNFTLYAYNASLGSGNNDNYKNFHANLKLCEAYLDAFEIYNNVMLTASYNVLDEIPNFIFSQDVLKITCNYTHESILKKYYITDANITYLFKYPNGTLLESFEEHIEFNVTTGSVAERTKITCTNDTNNDLNGTYFNISTPSNKFYVWFNISDSGAIDPSFSDRVGIKISNVTTNATKEQVASNLTSALEASGNFSVFQEGENVTVTNLELGIIENATDGSAPKATNFTIEVLIDGANRTVTEHVLLFPITENLPLEEGYSIHIFANTTFFAVALALKNFNVISGLENMGIEGLESSLFQGQTINITLQISSTRKYNITLNGSLEGDGFIYKKKEINFTSLGDTLVSFEIIAEVEAVVGTHEIHFKFKNGTVIYLDVPTTIIVTSALDYDNLIYDSKTVSGDKIQVSLNLINHLPENSTSLNMSFTGEYISDVLEEITLNEKETRTVSFELSVSNNVNEDSIEVEMSLLKGNSIVETKTLTIEVLSKFEIISSSFPDKINQGEFASLIIIIQNNQDVSENFSLSVNGIVVESNLKKLSPGKNRIVEDMLITINPYEIGKKTYEIILKDNSGEIIAKLFFEVELELSTINMILFYIIPIAIPIAIILFYKNKDIKNKLLRR